MCSAAANWRRRAGGCHRAADPGVLNNETSALPIHSRIIYSHHRLFQRPEEFRGWKVPDVLLSGNHKLIDEWRREQSVKRTEERRPDIME